MFELLERSTEQRHALLVAVCPQQSTVEHANEMLDELAELAETYGAEASARRVIRLSKPQARYLIGSGNADSIVEQCREQKLDMIIFDDELSPSQQRNWEKLAEIPVVDRHEVILGIFGRRARTREAKLQVQLAQSEYSLPRLKNAWTHLSRQQGGVGIRGGEGEKQIELGRENGQASHYASQAGAGGAEEASRRATQEAHAATDSLGSNCWLHECGKIFAVEQADAGGCFCRE